MRLNMYIIGPKQMFHVPDLEQETDGLDMMQDYAPAHVQIKRSAPRKKAIPQAAHASRKSDETVRFQSFLTPPTIPHASSPHSKGVEREFAILGGLRLFRHGPGGLPAFRC